MSDAMSDAKWSMQLEMISCSNCRACLSGAKRHGPFWYGYKSKGEGGKQVTVSKYFGKYRTEGGDPYDPAGVHLERAREMREMAKVFGEVLPELLTEEQRENLDTIADALRLTRAKRREAKRETDPKKAESLKAEWREILASVEDVRKELTASVRGNEQPSTYLAMIHEIGRVREQGKPFQGKQGKAVRT